MSKILAVHAREILDSRGNPTVECDVKTQDGVFRASVPSGASTGAHEVVELRDGGKLYLGLSVSHAVKNVNNIIARKITGVNPQNQQEIDSCMIALDGTPNKSRLGANAILAVSLAVAKAGACEQGLPLYEHIGSLSGNKKFTLPVPAFNIINGGKHAGDKLDIQEYLIMPVGAKNFTEALRMGSEIYHTLKNDLEHQFGKTATNVGDEGGFAPPFTCMEEPLDAISDVLIRLGLWKKVKLGIDCAATSFWKGKKYYVEGKDYSSSELLERYEELAAAYPLVSIEDPFYEEDFMHFAQLRKKVPIQIVGDDLLVTNPLRIKKAIMNKSCNCLLLKVNQIGTLSESLAAARLAKNAKWNIMTSHRSGETDDSFISDLAVGIASSQIKAGAPCRGERVAKYNQLIRIEEELGKKASYAGKTLRFD